MICVAVAPALRNAKSSLCFTIHRSKSRGAHVPVRLTTCPTFSCNAQQFESFSHIPHIAVNVPLRSFGQDECTDKAIKSTRLGIYSMAIHNIF